MSIWSERDFLLYKRMAAELRQVAADIRIGANATDSRAGCATRLEAYASEIDTELRVEIA
ncbi:MAG: hypothetical protein HKM95_15960 [Inquilinus sp.]|nr:hypothetical protein [Inquilinus sp.]